MTPEPFTISVPESTLDDLRDRLSRIRWPMDLDNEDWKYGTSGSYLRPLMEYWGDGFDWRAVESEINAFENYRVEIEGVPIHFLRQRSSSPDAVPLLLMHGWPWTFWDFRDFIRELADPEANEPAFDIVVPSLPGFGFSSPIEVTGIGAAGAARMMNTLMTRVLGFDRFALLGGDWGAVIGQRMAMEFPENLIGAHLSRYRRPAGTVVGLSTATADDYGPSEVGDFERDQRGMRMAASHGTVHTMDPQTLAYALEDSPVGLASWLIERRRAWSDCDGDLDSVMTRDDLLTLCTIYWVTSTIGSAMRFYWETAHEAPPAIGEGKVITCPLAIGVLPADVNALPRKFAEEDTNLVRWTRYPRGGHFGPAEVPELLAEDLRSFVNQIR